MKDRENATLVHKWVELVDIVFSIKSEVFQNIDFQEAENKVNQQF